MYYNHKKTQWRLVSHYAESICITSVDVMGYFYINTSKISQDTLGKMKIIKVKYVCRIILLVKCRIHPAIIIDRSAGGEESWCL